MNKSILAVATLAALVGCGEFEVESIVLDMRILAISVEPPEVLITEEQANDPTSIEQLDVRVCALVADPVDSRSLSFDMAVCAPTGSRRCDEPGQTVLPMGTGTVDDPEEASAPVDMCLTVPPDFRLLMILQESVETDALSQFGGVEIQFDLNAYETDSPPSSGVFGMKRMLLAPLLPAERVPNSNPTLDELQVTLPDERDVITPFGRCTDIDPLVVAPGETINFTPIEAEGAREDYVLPTFDGDVRMFTENLTYRWYATYGDWQRQGTGGPRDAFGNEPQLDSEWTAPEDLSELSDPLDVNVWLVQRDERGGLTWYETCVRVEGT